MELSAESVISRYIQELGTMTNRALVAEAGMAELGAQNAELQKKLDEYTDNMETPKANKK
jgi:hypothetical protein